MKKNPLAISGTVFNIQRFSLHDGPGIRTTVFFKGCGMRCLWCHNPESQSEIPELMLHTEKCVGCGKCTEYCNAAFTDKCTHCGKCADVCRYGARERCGYTISADELYRELSADRDYYEESGGGITLSGGEPLLQPKFAAEVLRLCRSGGIHTAVETAGNIPTESVRAVLPYTNLFLFDIKCMSKDLHKRLTGVSNSLILENAECIAHSGASVIFRTVVVPNYNTSEVEEVAHYAKKLGARLELMPYHNICSGKYAALGREFATSDAEVPTDEDMARLSLDVQKVCE